MYAQLYYAHRNVGATLLASGTETSSTVEYANQAVRRTIVLPSFFYTFTVTAGASTDYMDISLLLGFNCFSVTGSGNTDFVSVVRFKLDSTT
jgi:hypothetical protein